MRKIDNIDKFLKITNYRVLRGIDVFLYYTKTRWTGPLYHELLQIRKWNQ